MRQFMTANTLEDRKKQISEIKASFPDTGKAGEPSVKTEDDGIAFRFSKIRLLIAVLIFTAFLYCDHSQLKFRGYTTKEIYEKIEESISIEKIMQTLESVV